MISYIFSVGQKYRFVLSVIYLGILITLSLMPSDEVPDIGFFEGFDKFVHVCMYIGFSWLFCWSFYTEDKPLLNYLIILFAVIWGVVLEIFQLTMEFGRSFEWIDVLANATGALMGTLIYHLMAGKMKFILVSQGKDKN